MTLTPLEQRVRLHVYEGFVDRGEPPTLAESADHLGVSTDGVAAARRKLAGEHAIALRPGTAEVWMAHPFSAVPTPYRVVSGDRSWWPNCGWDALSIPTLLGVDARIEAACADCNEPIHLAVAGGELRGDLDAVVQFCVPPSQFWDDIGYT